MGTGQRALGWLHIIKVLNIKVGTEGTTHITERQERILLSGFSGPASGPHTRSKVIFTTKFQQALCLVAHRQGVMANRPKR